MITANWKKIRVASRCDAYTGEVVYVRSFFLELIFLKKFISFKETGTNRIVHEQTEFNNNRPNLLSPIHTVHVSYPEHDEMH